MGIYNLSAQAHIRFTIGTKDTEKQDMGLLCEFRTSARMNTVYSGAGGAASDGTSLIGKGSVTAPV